MRQRRMYYQPHDDSVILNPPRQVSESYELFFTALKGSPASLHDPGEADYWEPDRIVIQVGENRWIAGEKLYLLLLRDFAEGFDCLIQEKLRGLKTEMQFAYNEHLSDLYREEVLVA